MNLLHLEGAGRLQFGLTEFAREEIKITPNFGWSTPLLDCLAKALRCAGPEVLVVREQLDLVGVFRGVLCPRQLQLTSMDEVDGSVAQPWVFAVVLDSAVW